jgi:hypothetical protein
MTSTPPEQLSPEVPNQYISPEMIQRQYISPNISSFNDEYSPARSPNMFDIKCQDFVIPPFDTSNSDGVTKIQNPIKERKREFRKYFKDKVKHNFSLYHQNLDDLKKHCWEGKLLHEISFKYFNRFSLCIGFMAIIITAISGICSYLLNIDRFSEYETDFKITIMVLTTISTLFQSLLKGFEWDSKSEAHSNSSEQYGHLLSDVDLFQKELQNHFTEIHNYINIFKLKIHEEQCVDSTCKVVIDNEAELRDYVMSNYETINKRYVIKIKELNKIYSNVRKQNKYIIPNYAQKKKDKVKLTKFIRMMKLNAQMDYIKMRSDNLKKIINTENYESTTSEKKELNNFHPPSISWINIDQLLNYQKTTKQRRFWNFVKKLCCPCYKNKKHEDNKNIYNNQVLNGINRIKNGNESSILPLNTSQDFHLMNDEKWKTKHQIEKDWILKTTEITTRLNKIREGINDDTLSNADKPNNVDFNV